MSLLRRKRPVGIPAEKQMPPATRFLPPVFFTYRYRPRHLGWLVEAHDVVREALLRRLSKAVRSVPEINERILEIPFALRALDLPPGSRVLDIGSRWSSFPLQLASLGYRTVAVDLEPMPIQGMGPGVVLADLRRPPFKPNSFDGATMISTLEHVGVGFYEAHSDTQDDFRLMKELRRIVRPGGVLVLTVPFGRPAISPLQRAYDMERLKRVTEGWAWEVVRFAVVEGLIWHEAPADEAARRSSADRTRAVALLYLRNS